MCDQWYRLNPHQHPLHEFIIGSLLWQHSVFLFCLAPLKAEVQATASSTERMHTGRVHVHNVDGHVCLLPLALTQCHCQTVSRSVLLLFCLMVLRLLQ